MSKELDKAYNIYLDDWKGRRNNEWHLTKEEFINKIKTDDNFRNKWTIKPKQR